MPDQPVTGSGERDPMRVWFLRRWDRFSGAPPERRLAPDGGELQDGPGDDVEELATRVDEMDDAIASLGSRLDELIRDVRERVIQVKRETDQKAPSDHDHPSIATDLDRIEARMETLSDEFTDLKTTSDELVDRIDVIDDRVDRGFSNFEEIIEYLLETTDEGRGSIETVARTTLDLRDRVRRLSRAEARRAAADGLRATANENGIVEAKCENCGGRVDLRLLSTPDCPDCDARFIELVPKRGFFRSSLLHTGERPALEGEVAGEPTDLISIVDEEESAPPPREGDRADGRPATDADAHDPTARVHDDTVDDSGGNAVETARSDRADPSRDGANALDVGQVSGVGPTYAERLHAAGVDTVGDLALADPARLAREADIEPGRVEILTRRARELAESE